MRPALLLVACAGAVASCSKVHEPRSYDYFRAHPAERAEVIRKCRHGEGDTQYEPQAECPTAANAQATIDREHDQQAFEKR